MAPERRERTVVFQENVKSRPRSSTRRRWLKLLRHWSLRVFDLLTLPPPTVTDKHQRNLHRFYSVFFLLLGALAWGAAHDACFPHLKPGWDGLRLALRIIASVSPFLLYVLLRFLSARLVGNIFLYGCICFPYFALLPGYFDVYRSNYDANFAFLTIWSFSVSVFHLAILQLARTRFMALVTVFQSVGVVLTSLTLHQDRDGTMRLMLEYLLFLAVLFLGVHWHHISDNRLLQTNAQEIVTARKDARFKSQFLATMSHELRTPLNGILGGLDLLQETVPTELQAEYIQMCQECTEQMLTLVNDFLDVSSIAEGKLKMDMRIFDVTSVVDNVVSQLHPRALKKGLELLPIVDSYCPPLLIGDPSRLKQVLLNLVGNATKFTQLGHVVVRVYLMRVEMRQDHELRPDDTVESKNHANRVRLRFEVVDSGIGISEADQERLFTRFTQVEKTHSRRFDGTGLGLAISKDLVALMNGDIGVVSAPGKGSTFWFTAEFGFVPSEKHNRSSSSPGFSALSLPGANSDLGDVEMQSFQPRTLVMGFHPNLHMHYTGSCEIPGCSMPVVSRSASSSSAQTPSRTSLKLSGSGSPLTERKSADVVDDSSDLEEGEVTMVRAEPSWARTEPLMNSAYQTLLRRIDDEILAALPQGTVFDVFVCHGDKQVCQLLQQQVNTVMRNCGVKVTVRTSGTLHGAGGWAKADAVVLDATLIPAETLSALLASAGPSAGRQRTIIHLGARGPRQQTSAKRNELRHLLGTRYDSPAATIDRSALEESLQLVASTPVLFLSKPLRQLRFFSAVRLALDIKLVSTLGWLSRPSSKDASPVSPGRGSGAAAVTSTSPNPEAHTLPAELESIAPEKKPSVTSGTTSPISGAEHRTNPASPTGSTVVSPLSSPLLAALASPTQLRILAAEDNEVNQKLLVALFKSLNIDGVLVGNGLECVRAYRASLHEGGARFNMILMDCQMPVMDGYDATREVRALERELGAGRIPIVACTADATSGVSEECKQAGMDSYITKPVRKAVLQQTIEDWAKTVSEKRSTGSFLKISTSRS